MSPLGHGDIPAMSHHCREKELDHLLSPKPLEMGWGSREAGKEEMNAHNPNTSCSSAFICFNIYFNSSFFLLLIPPFTFPFKKAAAGNF